MQFISLSRLMQSNMQFISLSRLMQSNMGRAKQKSAFEHEQKVRIHIILHMRKVSSGHLLSIDAFYSA